MDISRNFQLEIFSNQYYNFLDKFAHTDFEEDKLLGKFYTHPEVGQQMISEIVCRLSSVSTGDIIKIVDPFCGDGRLIYLFLQEIAKSNELSKKHFHIHAWDIDGKAVDYARTSIQKCVYANHIEADITAEKIDVFVAYADYEETFDVCITNPPWGLLKPQKLFNSRCTDAELEDYKSAIAVYDQYMRQEFPLSQPIKKFGKWGTNLARCGVEVALRIINSSGFCGIVSPATLFNDQVSAPLRKFIFEDYKVHSISFFPAELKLFGSADIASVTAVIGRGSTVTPFSINLYNRDFHKRIYTVNKTDWNYIVKSQFVLPLELGLDAFSILRNFEHLPTVEVVCKENNLKFVRELDETRISEKILPTGTITFVKGYMIDRYTFSPDGQFLNESVITPPESVNEYKLVWRDVSRSSQIRRLKATLLPPLHIVGNSLGAIVGGHQCLSYLTILLGIMNSFVFEFQARSRLVSNHVPAGIIKTLKVPACMDDTELISLVNRKLNGENTEAFIEAYVAKLYNLSYQQYCFIIDTFGITDAEKEELKNISKTYLYEKE